MRAVLLKYNIKRPHLVISKYVGGFHTKNNIIYIITRVPKISGWQICFSLCTTIMLQVKNPAVKVKGQKDKTNRR